MGRWFDLFERFVVANETSALQQTRMANMQVRSVLAQERAAELSANFNAIAERQASQPSSAGQGSETGGAEPK
jgi:hypothetical protein